MQQTLLLLAFATATIASPAGFDTLNFVGGELLGRPTDHSVTVNVIPRAALEVGFEYGTDTTYGDATPAETTEAGVPLKVVLDELQADTRYFYRMCYVVLATDDSLTGPTRTFHTHRPTGERYTFAVEADPHMVPGEGDTTDAFELTLANIAADTPDFLIDLGDNFMFDKWKVVTDDTIRERMYSYRRWWDAVCHSIPLYIVLGNHEGEQGWDFDSTPTCRPVLLTNARKLYYPNPLPDGFYSGDSIPEPFVDLREDYYSWEWGNALFVALDPYWHTMIKPNNSGNNWDWTLGRAQYDWLKATLEASDARFKFVFIHHLVGGKIDASARGGSEYAHYYEWGGQNSDSTWGWDTLRPGWGVPIHQLLIDNDVDILWHGHDHFYAKQDTDGVIYQMVPQPGRTRWDSIPNQAQEYGYLSGIFIGSRGHVRVTMDDTSATVEYVRAFLPSETSAVRHNRDVAHSYTIVKKDGAVSSPRLVGSPASLSVSPNPFRRSLLIALEHTTTGPLDRSSVRIFDSGGRLVRTLAVPSPLATSSSLAWDGTTNSGVHSAPGVYFVEAGLGPRLQVVKIR
jgi:hypothetical protein